MKKRSDIIPKGFPIEQEDESIEKMAPLLHSISKENPFSVPENYFEELPSQAIKRCREEIGHYQKSALLEKFKFYVLGYKWRFLAVTGCLAILCLMVISRNNPVSYEALAKNIPDSLIIEHFDKNITDVNLSALEEISAENTAGQEQDNTASAKNSSDSANADQQDIIAYLMNTNISVSDIENEP